MLSSFWVLRRPHRHHDAGSTCSGLAADTGLGPQPSAENTTFGGLGNWILGFSAPVHPVEQRAEEQRAGQAHEHRGH